MASQAQTIANQQNSSKSTGPTTPEGKAASSRNALKHGLTSRRLLPGENPEEFASLRQSHLDLYRPANSDEDDLVDTLVWASWNIRRYYAMHDEVLANLMSEGEGCSLAEAFIADCRGAKVLNKLFRYQRDLQRIHDRTVKELDAILEIRRQQQEAAEAEARQNAKSAPKIKPLTLDEIHQIIADAETLAQLYGETDETNPIPSQLASAPDTVIR